MTARYIPREDRSVQAWVLTKENIEDVARICVCAVVKRWTPAGAWHLSLDLSTPCSNSGGRAFLGQYVVRYASGNLEAIDADDFERNYVDPTAVSRALISDRSFDLDKYLGPTA